MNIFFLNRDPEQAAKEHVDKHVVKMIVELQGMSLQSSISSMGERKQITLSMVI